jgi:predicted molibdopterin-dependent oxidoreductase YjgC
MFTPFEENLEKPVTFSFDGRKIIAPEGTTLAAALLGAGISELRSTAVSASPRGPFCMMGACFDCLVQIDGLSVQACMTPVYEGLVVERVSSPAEPPASDTETQVREAVGA